jgi:hypothetical protein
MQAEMVSGEAVVAAPLELVRELMPLGIMKSRA